MMDEEELEMGMDEALARLRAVGERLQVGEPEPLERLVARMRRAQVQYFKTRGYVDLLEARRLEKLVDAMLLRMEVR